MQVDFFYGSGLNIPSKDLGYGNRDWKIGDLIEVEDWTEEDGSFTEYYEICGFEQDTDSGAIGAKISYLHKKDYKGMVWN